MDLDLHEERLRAALAAEPGIERDAQLMLALTDDRTLLEGEPSAEWALRPRERLEWARQEARLALARDRTGGKGRSQADAVIEAWEACLRHDPTCEEAAAALVRLYAAHGRHALATSAYERCRAAMEDLGLRASPALDEARAAMTARPRATSAAPATLAGKEERRLVSVLFAELTRPMGTGPALGAEDVRELVGGALAEVVAEVERLGGTVTSVSGAGLVGLFGAPEAHEDDPERAVLAGFRIVSGAAAREGLSLRVGVETGEAVVGSIGGGSRAYYGAVGGVVGAAAALQSMARAGSVLVGPATRAAAEGIFDWGPTEEVAAPPGTNPLRGTYLQRPKARASRPRGGSRSASTAALVGREAELAVLQAALRGATTGKGEVVLITGDPGLGKSRLVDECRRLFMAWVGAGSGRLPLWLEGRGASYASSTPYGLYQQLLSTWVGVSPEEGEGVFRPALERAMKALFPKGTDIDDHVALLAQLIGSPRAPSTGSARLTPEQLRRAVFAAVRSVLSRLMTNGPTVLVLEDLHWADPTSLRLTEELSSLTSEGPLLLVLTRRHEPDPGASVLEASLSQHLRPVLRTVDLLPLARGDERHLAQLLLGGSAQDEVLDALSKTTEGNPLFLEERLSSLLETGALVSDESGWHLDQNVAGAVPKALERIVRSRVDRLSAFPREVIVAASALGAEFGLDALATVTGPGGELALAVDELCAAGLLEQMRGNRTTYRFRHALIQDATYKGLLRDERVHLHARAAWGLEEAWAGRVEEVAAVLGHHFAMAGEDERAVHFLELAGDQAAAAFANDEAIGSFRSALAIADKDRSRNVAMARATVGLRAKLAEVLWRRARREEAREALREAIGLATHSDSLQTCRLHTRLGRLEMADYHYDAALAVFDAAERLLGDYQEGRDDGWADQWLETLLDGRACLHIDRQEPELALAALEVARPVLEARGSPARQQAFYWLLARWRASQNRWWIDEEDIANARRALAAATQGGDEVDIAFAARDIGYVLLLHGDLVEAKEHFEKSLAMAQRIGDTTLRAQILTWLVLTALRRHDMDWPAAAA